MMFPTVAILLSATPLQNITAQITPVITMMIDVLEQLASNTWFAFLFACGLVRIGMNLIKKAKKTSK